MSSFSEGQTHQLMEALERDGWTGSDVTALGQYKELSQIRAVLREHAKIVIVKHASNSIVRHVTVDRTRTPQQVLEATGRKQYTDKSVVKTMPQGDGNQAEIHFFKLDYYVNDDDLENEYARRGLVPADPYSLAKVNEDDPNFADECSNGTHWKDRDFGWCFITFYRLSGECILAIQPQSHNYYWDRYWWFAGVRLPDGKEGRFSEA